MISFWSASTRKGVMNLDALISLNLLLKINKT
jgi:hypothetical protein